MNTQKNTHIQSIHYCHFSCIKKQQNLSSYTFPYEKRLLEILQKAYEKVFRQLSLAYQAYTLIIFLKRVFDHITTLHRNHQEFFMA